MSLVLTTTEGRELTINVWNWGVLHHLVAEAELFPVEVWEPLRYNGGGDLDAAEVARLADFLADRVLPRLREGERIFFDGTTTDTPDDGTLYREASERWKNYSLSRELLVHVIELLRSVNGAVSFS